MDSLNIIAVCDGEHSSATLVMRNIQLHSKHNIDIQQWVPEILPDTDMVYFHYGGLLGENNPQALECLDVPVKTIAGLRGHLTLKRWAIELSPIHFHGFINKLDAVSCASMEMQRTFSNVEPDIPTFICHSGVDTETFTPRPLPEEFCIGWAGNAYSGAKMFPNFIKLPFSKRTAGDGIGTYRAFRDMPSFYHGISVYVSTSVEEGSPVPPKEAAACGRPVVAIGVGDLVEWVPEEFLVDEWKQLIPVLNHLYSDGETLREVSEWFRELSLKWDYRVIVEEYDDMFREVI